MEMEKATAKVTLALVARLFEARPSGPTVGQHRVRGRRTETGKRLLPAAETEPRISFILLRGSFAFLLFGKPLLIFLQPAFQIGGGLFEFVAVQQPPSQRFEKRPRADVIGEFFVCFLIGA